MSGSVANTLWARALVDELARAGLRDVVIAPGSRSTPLVLAVADDARLRARVHLDERSAAFFALGVGKASGRPAAVVTTSGTAVANLLPAVVEASQSGVPLLLLTADRPPRLRGADANQAIDQVGIFGPYARAFHELAPPTAEGPALRHLRGVASRAYRSAIGPDAGPVHINAPFDKPLEPAEPDASFLAEHPLAATGRPDGAPFTRVIVGRSVLSDAELDELIASMDATRGVIVAGPSERGWDVGPSILRLAAATGIPVLADPLSGARCGSTPGASIVSTYDLFLRDEEVRAGLAPTVVLRVGSSPTSAALQRWLLHHDGVEQIVLSAGGRWKDHGATATRYLTADEPDTLDRLAERWSPQGSVDAEWRGRWERAELAARAVIERATADGVAPEEAVLARQVVEAATVDGGLFVSSSMPIRDVDAFGGIREMPVPVFANRGASGIDGVVSSSFGVASALGATTVCVIGDVAFFHDQNGLLWSREADARVVFVVVDNDGGGIFQMLPISDHEPHFTRFFATPHAIDPRHAAEAHGLSYEEVDVDVLASSLAEALSAERSAVLRVRTDRVTEQRRRTDLATAVARSVRQVLG
ncbi:MAG: 2-succinyl-5-enolpyruvyl-6-hydroxy-3-cyclohexene-1-carboxylic-acid synthase [Gemmatimonadota bacterium]|nr:2-succinyl-5-enolpyruvyl-6-hydroxy-3-cyclohexene-1-carboxylic-acid synthase [Gemmatimonadota bacterium]MDH3424516.1 2-succinyl-5-enolpyruvyl-6-hydroxy-3-cyclohexene-1-carboxylic-acid synthase [Gemmatimonadota bacterium]